MKLIINWIVCVEQVSKKRNGVVAACELISVI